MESYRIGNTFDGQIKLPRGETPLDPMIGKDGHGTTPDEMEALSQIIHELNERFGTEFSEKDRVSIEQLESKLVGDVALMTSIRVNTPENARLAFDHAAKDSLQEMVDTNFELYKRVTEDADFGEFFLRWLFERARKAANDWPA